MALTDILLIGKGYLGTRIAELLIAPTIWSTTAHDRVDWQTLQSVIICVAPQEMTVEGYRRAYLDVFDTLGPTINHLVYISSTSVYGEQDGRIVDEATPLNPSSEYARILIEAEERALALGGCVLRLGGLYGPGRTLEARAQKLSGTVAKGDGSCPVNLTHVDLAAKAVALAVETKLRGVYNVVEDRHMTREELYNSLADQPIQWDGSQTVHSSHKIVSNHKIKEAGLLW